MRNVAQDVHSEVCDHRGQEQTRTLTTAKVRGAFRSERRRQRPGTSDAEAAPRLQEPDSHCSCHGTAGGALRKVTRSRLVPTT